MWNRHLSLLLPVVLLTGLLLSACSAPTSASAGEEPAARQVFAMNTIMSLQLYGPDKEAALEAAVDEIGRLDALFDRNDPDSDIARLNAHAGDGSPVALAPETVEVLSAALDAGTDTDGAFDVTVAPVIDAWGFGTGDAAQYRLPSRSELDGLLPLVDASALHVDASAGTAWLDRAGMEVDLGGIAKGYTAARLDALLDGYDVTDALLDLGSSTIALRGTNAAGDRWRVAVKDPKDPDRSLLVLSLSDETLSTSGAYEQCFTEDGVTYHHILDPRTGWPGQTGICSVTVVGGDSARTDALSTALFLMGPDEALDLWRRDGSFDCVLCLEDGRILLTEGLEDRYAFADDTDKEDGHGWNCEIVCR